MNQKIFRTIVLSDAQSFRHLYINIYIYINESFNVLHVIFIFLYVFKAIVPIKEQQSQKQNEQSKNKNKQNKQTKQKTRQNTLIKQNNN